MKPEKVTEAEILDSLLRGADEEVVVRVRKGLCTDLKMAMKHAGWAGFTETLEEPVSALREKGDEVSERVMERLAQSSEELPEVPEDLFEVRPPKRNRRWLAALAAAAMVALVACLGFGFRARATQTFVVTNLRGAVFEIGPKGSSSEVTVGQRLRFPTNLRVSPSASIALIFPYGTQVSSDAASHLELTNARAVRQASGTVTYNVAITKPGLDNFTVDVPDGQIVDLGTVFEVAVKEDQRTVVRVDSGRVRVLSMGGATSEAGRGEWAILTVRGAATERAPVAGPLEGNVLESAVEEVYEDVDVAYDAEEKTLQLGDSLRTFLKPRQVTLSANRNFAGLRKLPPFTSSVPLIGVVPMRMNGRDVDVFVACDTKLNGKGRVYLDANLNGDLTDDPSFDEGEDYLPGRPFAVGLMGRNDALWLERPMRVNLSASPPAAEVIEDRLNVVNRVYLDGLVVFRPAYPGAVEAKQRYLVLDADSDGDFGDSGGSLGIWVRPNSSSGQPCILAVAPTSKAASFLGYKWRLSRNLSGDLRLHGINQGKEDSNRLNTGMPFPSVWAETVDGHKVAFRAPDGGYLLAYAWTTWFSSCQRDVSAKFEDLWPQFKDRGLLMVGISVDYQKEDLLRYVKANKIEFPQVYNGADMTEGVMAELGIARAPLAVLVDATGTVVNVGKSAEELWSFLDRNLPNQDA